LESANLIMEIERKFLVDKKKWEKLKKPEPIKIIQGYLINDKGLTIRIRTKGEKAFLTIKGPTQGISREEFEYEIPFSDAENMLELFTPKTIIKRRYTIKIGNHLWEIDEFEDQLEGLLIAEIELKDEEETFELPHWVLDEVSTDQRYFNANLVKLIESERKIV